ncbi:MAG: ASCH domain-containing protein [Patescibacteria group bacterium]
MEQKTLKFRNNLADLVTKGEKTTTWRLFDDKDLKEGDTVSLLRWDTKEKFGEAKILKVWEKTMGTLEDSDFDGHEKFETQEEMYATYKKYYGERVNENSPVKIIQFKVLN